MEGWARLAAAQADAGAALGPGVAAAAARGGDALARAIAAQREAWRAAAEAAARGAASGVGAATLARYLDPGQWLFGAEDAPDPALRRLIAAPESSPLIGGALAGSPQARTLAQAVAAHRALVAAAFQRMAAKVAREAAANAPLTLEAAQRAWVAAARQELDALHASDAFLASQAKVVAAAVALRAAEAAAAADWCVAHALPTRAEVDDLARALAALRRELRALKRELGKP